MYHTLHIYSRGDSQTVLAGVAATNHITNPLFYYTVSITFVSDNLFSLYSKGDELVPSNTQLGQNRKYYYSGFGDQIINTKPWLARTYSIGPGGIRIPRFKYPLLQRDGRCHIIRQRASQDWAGLWFGFQAAHVFPLSQAHE